MVEAAGICDPAQRSACFQWGASAKCGVTLIQSHQCCAAALTEPGAIRKHLHDIRLPARAAVTRYQRTSLCPIRSARSLASATAGRTSSKRLFIGRVQGSTRRTMVPLVLPIRAAALGTLPRSFRSVLSNRPTRCDTSREPASPVPIAAIYHTIRGIRAAQVRVIFFPKTVTKRAIMKAPMNA